MLIYEASRQRLRVQRSDAKFRTLPWPLAIAAIALPTCPNIRVFVFINELSHHQRSAFLVLARQIIDADDRLALPEVEILDRLYAEAGMEPEHADAPNAAGDLNLLFPTERARAVVLLELLLVGFSDGRLHPREESAILKIASRLQVDQGLWSSILDWAHRYAILAEEARRFGRSGV